MSTKIFYGLCLLLAVYCICDAVSDDERPLPSDIGSDTNLTKYDGTFYHPQTKVAFPRVNQPAVFKAFSQISFHGANCNCASQACHCCTGVQIKSHNFDKQICANAQYLPKQVGIEASLTVGGKNILSKSVSLSNPPAICQRIPDFPIVKLCVQFYNLSKVGNKLHGCIDLQARVSKLPALKLHFKCFNI